MSKLNKLVTNYPVSLSEEEVENLSATLAPVVAACGGGGGGTGGKIYTGIGFVSVNNSTNQIGLTEAANTKLNQDIPTKVSDLSDSANYQTVAGMDEYLTTANASSTYQTKEAMSAYATREWTTNGFVTEQKMYDTLQDYVNYPTLNTRLLDKQDKLTFAYDNDKISAINGSALAGQGGITGDYYSASNPSGFITPTTLEPILQNKHYVTSSNEIILGSAQYGLTTAGWTVIQGAGGGTGITEVSHDTTLSGNGNSQALGVNFNHVQPKGDYLSSNALVGYATTALLDTISSKIENDIPTTVAQLTDSGNYYKKTETSGATELSTEFGKYALKSEIPTVPRKVSDLTDSANYYKTTETSSKNELSTEFAKYLTTAQYNTDSATFALKTDLNDLVSSASVTTNDNYVMTNTGWKVLTLPGGGMTQVYHDTTLTGDGNANDNQLGVVWSALSGNTIDSAKSAEWAVKAKTEGREYNIGSTLYTLNNWLSIVDGWAMGIVGDKGIEIIDTDNDTYPDTFQLTQTAYNAVTSVSSKLDTTAAAQTYLTKSSADNDYAPISITATVNTLTAASAGWNNKVDKPTSLNDKYLVLRTDSNGAVSGWCDFQDQSYSKSEALGTFVATANIDTTTLSGDGKSVSTKLGVKTDVIATIDYVSGNYLPTSGGTVSGDVIVKSTGKNLLAVNTTATLMGQSRVANLTDTTAIGTNWLGVNSLGGGFLKNVQGGNVGDLNGTSSIQINFASDGANSYGNITVNSQDNMSKVVHVPTASYNSMSSFDNTNGPNYMLRKTASGFDIGAAVINVTQLPAQTEANTYYFIYDT